MPADDEHWEPFAKLLSYVGTADGPRSSWRRPSRDAQREIGGTPRLLHYLSVPPSASAGIVDELRATGLNARARVIMEKPFGTDLASARELNATLLTAFDESQIFRIDHFLGKEAVQNILALRFANGLFEPVWNRNHIDHVQIDVPETLSIGTRGRLLRGHRRLSRHGRDTPLPGARLRRDGAPHVARAEDAGRREDQGLRCDAAAATCGRGPRASTTATATSRACAPDSETETFVAVRAQVDNWRWAGVPFFLRTGKRLAESRQVITIAFNAAAAAHVPARRVLRGGVVRVRPPDVRARRSRQHLGELPRKGARAHDGARRSADGLQLREPFGGEEHALEAYERLIHDVMIGDRTLFTTSEGIERLWEVSAPVLESPPPVMPYEPGSWGPEAIDELIAPRRWHLPAH